MTFRRLHDSDAVVQRYAVLFGTHCAGRVVGYLRSYGWRWCAYDCSGNAVGFRDGYESKLAAGGVLRHFAVLPPVRVGIADESGLQRAEL